MKRWEIILVLVLIAAFLRVVPASAQVDPIQFHISFGSDHDEGTYPWDEYQFIDDYGVVGSDHGDPVPAAQGVESFIDGDAQFGEVNLLVELPAGCEVGGVDYEWLWNNPGGTNSVHSADLFDAEMDLVYHITDASSSGEGAWTPFGHTFGPYESAYLQVRVWTIFSEPGFSGGFITLDNVYFSCTGIEPPNPDLDDLFQPIAEPSQIDIFPPIEGGEVLAASRISAVLNGPPLFPGAVPVYASIGGTVENVVQSGGGYALQIVNDLYEFSATYANLSRIYVEPGTEVEAGCVIGLAGPQFAAIDTDETGEIFQIIFSLNDDAEEELVDWTVLESPSGDTLCSTSDNDCINKNPHFVDGNEFWTAINGELNAPTLLETGNAVVPPGGSISQYLVLPSAGEWGVTIALQADDGPTYAVNDGEVAVKLSDDIVTENFTNQNSIVKLLDIGPLDPTTPTVAPDVYELRITNSESRSDQTRPSNLKIAFVCLYDWDGGSTTPDTCYFPDYEFDTGAGWELSAEATIEHDGEYGEGGTGFLDLPEQDESATTEFTLSGYADDAATYRVTVVTASTGVIGGSLFVEFDATDPLGDFQINFEMDGQLLGDWRTQTFDYEVPAGETYSGDFILFNNYIEGGIRVDSVCLEPANGQWPGYEGTTPGPIPTIPESCAIVPRSPVASEVNTWVGWVGALIRFFWTCRAPMWVAQIVAGIDGIQDWLAMLGRWLAVVMSLLWRLMWSTTQWGVYSLYNLIAGLVEEIWSVSSGAISLPWTGFSLLMTLLWTAFIAIISLVWTLLMALVSLAWSLFIALITLLWTVFSTLAVAFWTAIINLPLVNLFAFGAAITSLLFGLISEVLALIVTAFQVLVTMAQIIGTFFSAVQVGFNDDTSVDIGLIDCVTMLGTDPLYPLCMGFDLTQYAIDAFPIFNVIGLMLMAAVGYNTIRLTIDWYRQAFAEAS